MLGKLLQDAAVHVVLHVPGVHHLGVMASVPADMFEMRRQLQTLPSRPCNFRSNGLFFRLLIGEERFEKSPARSIAGRSIQSVRLQHREGSGGCAMRRRQSSARALCRSIWHFLLVWISLD